MLASAPSTFIKPIRQLTRGTEDVIMYLGYMLIFHAYLPDHLRGVNQMLERIRKFGLTIYHIKTYVAVHEVTFLGYTTKQGMIMPGASLVGKIINIQVFKQDRSLLGLINFYSTFVPKFSEIVACLTELTATAGTSTTNHTKWSSHLKRK